MFGHDLVLSLSEMGPHVVSSLRVKILEFI